MKALYIVINLKINLTINLIKDIYTRMRDSRFDVVDKEGGAPSGERPHSHTVAHRDETRPQVEGMPPRS